jgi:hypothetical protein
MTQATAGSLPAAHCSTCDRTAIVEWTLDADGELASLCIHCSSALTVERYVSLTEAVELGYVAPGHEPPSGDRGCRDGQCGVRQPES